MRDLRSVGAKLKIVLNPRGDQDGVLTKLKDCECVLLPRNKQTLHLSPHYFLLATLTGPVNPALHRWCSLSFASGDYGCLALALLWFD